MLISPYKGTETSKSRLRYNLSNIVAIVIAAINYHTFHLNQPAITHKRKALYLYTYLGFDAKYEYIPEHNSHAIIEIFANPSISGMSMSTLHFFRWPTKDDEN